MKKYFMAVTNDEYELPLCPPSTAEEVAKMLGLKVQSVRSMSCPKVLRQEHPYFKVRDYKIIGFYWNEQK